MVDLAWWEVETPWPDRFREFHGAMWGWTFEPAFEDAGIGRYWIVKEHMSATIGGLWESAALRPPVAGARMYLVVEDLEATLAYAVGHGASIERQRTGLGGDDRWFAIFRDPAGVSWGIWTDNEAAD